VRCAPPPNHPHPAQRRPLSLIYLRQVVLTSRPVSTLGNNVSLLPSITWFASNVPSLSCLKHTQRKTLTFIFFWLGITFENAQKYALVNSTFKYHAFKKKLEKERKKKKELEARCETWLSSREDRGFNVAAFSILILKI